MVPTNKPMIRLENADVVYRTEEEKFRNAAKEIKDAAGKRPAGSGGYHLGREIRKTRRAF